MPWKVGNKNTDALCLFYLLNSNCMDRGKMKMRATKKMRKRSKRKRKRDRR
jgi:hypothetical protein